MSRREIVKRELGPLLLLAALSLGALWRVTLAGRIMAPADLLLLMEPWKHHARQFPEFERVHNPILVVIPPGILHGFKCIGDAEAMVVNCPTEPYDPKAPDEFRVDAHSKDVPYDWARKDR